MISLLSGQMKYQIPTCQDLKEWICKDALREMHDSVDETRNSWADTGSSILLDGWTYANG